MEDLIKSAIEARKKAYVPYSKFPVGAALLTADAKIISGCNVENSSYGLSNCAERTALFTAISLGYKEYKALAVVAASVKPVSPCGACRQVLAELCSNDMPVFLANLKGDILKLTVFEFLPYAFQLKDNF